METLLILSAHLCGDFLLQNHWMQQKSKDSTVCLLHVITYMFPWVALLLMGICPEWIFVAVMAEHFLQDRFQLHVKWMQWYGHTNAHTWPMGPLCVDQAMHLTFIGVLFAVQRITGL